TSFPSWSRVCLATAEEAPSEPLGPSESPAQLVTASASWAIEGWVGTTDAFIVVPVGDVVACWVVAPVAASARTGSLRASRIELGGGGTPGGTSRLTSEPKFPPAAPGQ